MERLYTWELSYVPEERKGHTQEQAEDTGAKQRTARERVQHGEENPQKATAQGPRKGREQERAKVRRLLRIELAELENEARRAVADAGWLATSRAAVPPAEAEELKLFPEEIIKTNRP